jgi:putative ABC transport system permease protein
VNWLTRLVLLMFPPEMRERHGEGIADLYRDMYWRKGFGGRFVYFVKLLFDAVPQGLGARFERRLPGGGPGRDPGPRPGSGILDQLWSDLRFAFRSLRRSPGFTAVTVATLGVGIGANVAIFSLVNGVLLTSLPYPDSERVVEFMYTGEKGLLANASVPDVEDIRNGVTALEAIAQVQSTGATLLSDDPVRLEMLNVGPGFFDIFRVPAALGRVFTADEYQDGEPPVVVLSQEFWRTTMSGDSAVVGRVLTLEGWDGMSDSPTLHAQVVGVMPEGFVDPYGPGTTLWMTQPGRYGRGTRIFQALGRVRDDHTIEEARAELTVTARNLAEAYPETNATLGMTVASANEQQISSTRRPLLVFMGAVGLLLLIACLNVASLLLSRGQNRSAELAVRAALGAGRGRIASQLLVESLVLGVLGGALGIGLAVVGLDALLALVAGSLPAGRVFAVDGTVVAFAILISIGTGLVFGVGPALRAGQHGAGAMGTKASESRM